ncbi:hypothetical protein BLA24_07715 [Streptomyces cinnamoneus]|uniref:Beta-lactamase-related domain-containing protein n=1 Tax=Streptomyces cinnamoneus TaxID=53446 RepID=A0A2G1XM55_STRCJ|nr:hypothetical protein BLA24_07715 [Streptomyces cinnamoneus]PPT11539.1 hypothetical protein CYQ11_00145 [Streptomyces cinnamoneus]
MTNVWSTTKTMTALCALVLADRTELDLYAPVAKYWPEFGAAGKDRIEVRHLLSHTAGLPRLGPANDAGRPVRLGEGHRSAGPPAPRWEPGTASGYHRFTHGFLIGEVIRRICQQSIGAYFADQIATRLDADFHIGLAAEHDHRVSDVVPAPGPAPSANPHVAIPVGAYVTAQDTWSTQWRRAAIPTADGYGNARSVAAVQSVLAAGGRRRRGAFFPKQPAARCSTNSPTALISCWAYPSDSAWATPSTPATPQSRQPTPTPATGEGEAGHWSSTISTHT